MAFVMTNSGFFGDKQEGTRAERVSPSNLGCHWNHNGHRVGKAMLKLMKSPTTNQP